MRLIRILILEDDLKTISKLLDNLYLLEEELASEANPKVIAVTVLSEYTQVEEYINHDKKHTYDIVLLDRDCKAGGSFHALDMEMIGLDKIIAISSVPPYNEEVKKLGVTLSIDKEYDNLDEFALRVTTQVKELIKRAK